MLFNSISLRIIKTTICFLVMATCSITGRSQASAQNYEKHANLIYLMTRYFDWPASSKQGEFIIGIYNNNDAFETFKRLIVLKKIGNQPIEIRKVLTADDASKCHLLFAPTITKKAIEYISSMTSERATLLVTQEKSSLAYGSCLNFRTEDEKLKIEINSANIRKRKINIDSTLLGLLERK